MAVSNQIVRRQAAQEKVTEYKCGEESIKLSPTIVRKYLVNGSGEVTDQEVAMFIGLCRYQHLNPFLREAYLIKFGNQPATIVTGKEAITKRAMRNAKFAGQQAGVVIYHEDTGEIEYRNGSLLIQGEKLAGGWAKVYVKGYDVPIEAAVSYAEYVGTKSNGEINSNWSKRPATMIRKVALMQALREAFPEDLGGMYASEEVGTDIDEAVLSPVEQPDVLQQTTQAPQTETQPVSHTEAQEGQQNTVDDLHGVF